MEPPVAALPGASIIDDRPQPSASRVGDNWPQWNSLMGMHWQWNGDSINGMGRAWIGITDTPPRRR